VAFARSFSVFQRPQHSTKETARNRLLKFIARKPKPKYHLPDADGNLPWVRPTSPIKLFRKKVPPLFAKYKPRPPVDQVPTGTKWIEALERKAAVVKKDVCNYVPWDKRQTLYYGPLESTDDELKDGVIQGLPWIPPELPRSALGGLGISSSVGELLVPPPACKTKTRKSEVGEPSKKKSRKDRETRKEKVKKGVEPREEKIKDHGAPRVRRSRSDGVLFVRSQFEDFWNHSQDDTAHLVEDPTSDMPMPVPVPRKTKEKKDRASRPKKKKKGENTSRLQELNEDGTPRENTTRTENRPRKKKQGDTDLARQLNVAADLLRERYINNGCPDCSKSADNDDEPLEERTAAADISSDHFSNVHLHPLMRNNQDEFPRNAKTTTADYPGEKATNNTNLTLSDNPLSRGNYITYASPLFRFGSKKPNKDSESLVKKTGATNPSRKDITDVYPPRPKKAKNDGRSHEKEKQKKAAPRSGVKARPIRIPRRGKTKNVTVAHLDTKKKAVVAPTKKSKDDAPPRAMKSIRDLFSREKKDEQKVGASQEKRKREVVSRTDKVDQYISSHNKKNVNIHFSGKKKVNDAAYYANKHADSLKFFEHVEDKLVYTSPLDQAYYMMKASSKNPGSQTRATFKQKTSTHPLEAHNRRPSLVKQPFSSSVIPTRQPTISERRGARPPARVGCRRPTLKPSITAPTTPTTTPSSEEPSSLRETLRRRPTIGDLVMHDISPFGVSPDDATPAVPKIPLSFASAAIGMVVPSVMRKCYSSLFM
jgi:hypothetical protein